MIQQLVILKFSYKEMNKFVNQIDRIRFLCKLNWFDYIFILKKLKNINFITN